MEGMEAMKDPNWVRDMKLQGELAFRIFRKEHKNVADDKKSHSDALGEWARGEDDVHVLTNYYRVILNERNLKPSDVHLDNDEELNELADAILARYESETKH